MKEYIKFGFIATIMLLATGCSSDSGSDVNVTEGINIELTAEEQSTMTHVQDFSLDLFDKTSSYLSVDAVPNFVISPISTAITMGLLANACDGVCQSEILESFGYGKNDVSALNNALGKLSKELSSTVSSASKLVLANSIWISDEFACKEQYQIDMQTMYDANVQQLSFADGASIINKWCADKTDGMINSLPVRGDYEANLMYLVNATYFNAPWSAPFKSSKEGVFNNVDGSTSKVKFMQEEQNVAYWNNESTEIVVLSYGKSKLKFLIAQCDDGYSFDNAYTSLRGFINNWETLTDIKTGETTLSMPKIEVESDIDIRSILTKMGVTSVFTPQNYCFSPIVESADLCVSQYNQSTKFVADEEGTKAASVTSVAIGDTFSPSTNYVPKTIDINRPFVYAVCDITNTKAIIMMGRVTKL